MKYEYMLFSSPVTESELVFMEKLNVYAKDGWKLITIIMSDNSVTNAFLERQLSV